MKTINEILKDYTTGETGIEETNAALKEAGAGYHLEPGRNTLTDEERRATVVGYYPEQASGYGLLETGTGTLDKVPVLNGRLNHPVNEVLVDGSVNMSAYVTICGKWYMVLGDKLAEVPVLTSSGTARLPFHADLSRRTELAGQTVEQRTKTGTYEVTYDANGYAVEAHRMEV